jgi:hypothetical protein
VLPCIFVTKAALPDGQKMQRYVCAVGSLQATFKHTNSPVSAL